MLVLNAESTSVDSGDEGGERDLTISFVYQR